MGWLELHTFILRVCKKTQFNVSDFFSCFLKEQGLMSFNNDNEKTQVIDLQPGPAALQKPLAFQLETNFSLKS